MKMNNDQQAQREARHLHANREELAERIRDAIHEDGTLQPLPGLYLSRTSVPLKRLHSVVESSVAVIAQGSKEVLLGESRYHYDPSRYLLTAVGLPRISQVLEASRERPYLALRLELAPTLVSSVLVEASHSFSKEHADVRAIDVSPMDGKLLDAFVRLVRLLDAPAEAQVLMPLMTREILYRLLMGEQGPRLRHLASWGATPPISPERSSDSGKTSTSHCASRISHENWNERLGVPPPL